MEILNQSLFLWLNASEHPPAALVALALFCAKYLILALPLVLTLGWLRGSPSTRQAMLAAAVAAGLGLAVSGLIGQLWPHPRPFVAGIGHTLLAHAPTASFPSNHLTLWWCVALSLLLHPATRTLGAGLALWGLPIAWARIYVGVHYPLDMLGALLLALPMALLCRFAIASWLLRLYELLQPLYQRLFAPAIRRGWVRR
ncbi:phosphatase PAP2 family protein [Acidovorax sp. HDW3]|uniref:phosphatase PAP2 family protein n=1 Tax=Acidovorax sp. HDW3 TaxID=2714923 RepID=UPI001409A32F|nr:phosphatase PAP2 family protein [Acidovorax sp. HDW3]QIL44950.1 phosphatase PAP2 family protein [Acidovorax sp. HDW3]